MQRTMIDGTAMVSAGEAAAGRESGTVEGGWTLSDDKVGGIPVKYDKVGGVRNSNDKVGGHIPDPRQASR